MTCFHISYEWLHQDKLQFRGQSFDLFPYFLRKVTPRQLVTSEGKLMAFSIFPTNGYTKTVGSSEGKVMIYFYISYKKLHQDNW